MKVKKYQLGNALRAALRYLPEGEAIISDAARITRRSLPRQTSQATRQTARRASKSASQAARRRVTEQEVIDAVNLGVREHNIVPRNINLLASPEAKKIASVQINTNANKLRLEKIMDEVGRGERKKLILNIRATERAGEPRYYEISGQPFTYEEGVDLLNAGYPLKDILRSGNIEYGKDLNGYIKGLPGVGPLEVRKAILDNLLYEMQLPENIKSVRKIAGFYGISPNELRRMSDAEVIKAFENQILPKFNSGDYGYFINELRPYDRNLLMKSGGHGSEYWEDDAITPFAYFYDKVLNPDAYKKLIREGRLIKLHKVPTIGTVIGENPGSFSISSYPMGVSSIPEGIALGRIMPISGNLEHGNLNPLGYSTEFDTTNLAEELALNLGITGPDVKAQLFNMIKPVYSNLDNSMVKAYVGSHPLLFEKDMGDIVIKRFGEHIGLMPHIPASQMAASANDKILKYFRKPYKLSKETKVIPEQAYMDPAGIYYHNPESPLYGIPYNEFELLFLVRPDSYGDYMAPSLGGFIFGKKGAKLIKRKK